MRNCERHHFSLASASMEYVFKNNLPLVNQWTQDIWTKFCAWLMDESEPDAIVLEEGGKLTKDNSEKPIELLTTVCDMSPEPPSNTIAEVKAIAQKTPEGKQCTPPLAQKRPKIEQPGNGGQAIDEDTSDGYHTFRELYRYRMLYNAAFFNMLSRHTGILVVKSRRHSDGELCFGGGWFIVMVQLPTGQVSNHYEDCYWGLFDVPAVEMAPEWDGHTPNDAADRLESFLVMRESDSDRSNPSGNTSALREALKSFCTITESDVQELVRLSRRLIDENIYGGGIIQKLVSDIGKARVALAAPVRNCEVGTAMEQEKRFKEFCDSHWDLNNADDNCARCPINKIRAGSECEFAWMQMLYESKEKSNEH